MDHSTVQGLRVLSHGCVQLQYLCQCRHLAIRRLQILRNLKYVNVGISCMGHAENKAHPLVHVYGCTVGFAHKEVHKVAIVHLFSQVLQDAHQLICKLLPSACPTKSQQHIHTLIEQSAVRMK